MLNAVIVQLLTKLTLANYALPTIVCNADDYY